MPGLIGKKIGMTNIFAEDGKNIPCTLLELGPCVVTQVKTTKQDGYESLQLGYGKRKEKNTDKALLGHFKKAKSTPLRKLKEFDSYKGEINLGDTLSVTDVFQEGEFVHVVGTTKGKGFQGVVKRHNFAGVGQSTHGQHNRLRAPGSIGACSTPSRVFKGMKMAGRTGNQIMKVENLKVLRILPEKNLILVNGSVPGAKNGFIIVEK